MLRITLEEGSDARATLRLDGSVAGEWATLLELECRGLLARRSAASVDLEGVGFVDRVGVEVLGRLARAGVQIRCPLGPVASVLEGEGVRFTRDAHRPTDGRR